MEENNEMWDTDDATRCIIASEVSVNAFSPDSRRGGKAEVCGGSYVEHEFETFYRGQ